MTPNARSTVADADRHNRPARNRDLVAADVAAAEARFGAPPLDARVMMRWWWFGPAETEMMIVHDLRAMRDAGLGGVEVSVVYPMALPDEPAVYLYLSQTFAERLGFAARTARGLGLRFDVTLGGGWSMGGPHVDAARAARRLRWQTIDVPPSESSVALPGTLPGEHLVAAYWARGTVEELPSGFAPIRPVEGVVEVPDPVGPRVLALAWSTPTRQLVKRAPLGGEGFLLDHYDPAAVARHLQAVGEPLLAAVEPGTVTALFCDSLEVHDADWTGSLPAAFASRRGYDLLERLPDLLHPRSAAGRRVRVDLGRTLTELYEESFVRQLADFAHSRGALLRLQGYGQPPAAISSYAGVDLIEGEGWHWEGVPPTRWASSAASVFGESVVSSETWTWNHSPSLRATPLDLQGEAHEHFLLGINQLVGHGWPSSPDLPAPAWVFYAAGDLSDRNPWWPAAPALWEYLARLSAVLRLGTPVRQVGLHVPDERAYAALGTGSRGEQPRRVDLWHATSRVVGDDLPRALREAGYDFDLLDDRALAQAGDRYQVIIEASDPLPTAAVIDELRARVTPDLQRADPRLIHVRRRLADGDLFFIANTGATRVVDTVTLPAHAHWERWDARTGAASGFGTGTTHDLDLGPYSAVVLVGHDLPRVRPTAAEEPEVALPVQWRTAGEPVGFPFVLDAADGSGSAPLVATVIAPGGRSVLDFGDGRRVSDTGSQATGLVGPAFRALHEPPVGPAVLVRVNGVPVGAVWAPPYRLDVELAPGENTLELIPLGVGAGALAGNPAVAERVRQLIDRFGWRFNLQDVDGPVDLPAVGLAHPPRVLAVRLPDQDAAAGQQVGQLRGQGPIPDTGCMEETPRQRANAERVKRMPFAALYPSYVAKVERKGRSRDELDTAIRWLTGFGEADFEAHLAAGTSVSDFFDAAELHPSAVTITGVVCGVRIADIADPLMRRIRVLDKIVDELAKGRPLERVLRAES